MVYQQVDVPPREQTALNYGHKGGLENPPSRQCTVELPVTREDGSYRVSTPSSTRNRKGRKKRSPTVQRSSTVRIRRHNSESSELSDESEPEPTSEAAEVEKGEEQSELVPDISAEVRVEVNRNQESPECRVRIDETSIFIQPKPRMMVDEYDILQDIREQKANVTIGQVLHHNGNYRK